MSINRTSSRMGYRCRIKDLGKREVAMEIVAGPCVPSMVVVGHHVQC